MPFLHEQWNNVCISKTSAIFPKVTAMPFLHEQWNNVCIAHAYIANHYCMYMSEYNNHNIISDISSLYIVIIIIY